MRVEILINRKDKKPLEVPQHYNHTIQAFIYNNIDKDLSRFLHDHGYQVDSRVFKLFTFSNLNGKFEVDKNRKKIRFENGVRLTIASSISYFIKSIVNNMVLREDLYISGQDVEISSIELSEDDEIGESETMILVSPLVVYSTIINEEGKKYTQFHNPLDEGYDKILSENLRKKYRAIYQAEPPKEDIKVTPIGDLKFRMTKYKDFIIKGCTGKIKIQGPSELIEVGVKTGFGSKNSQGFGCVKLIKN